MAWRHPAPERGEGFTLVELVVALTVLGVLVGIAIPTFLGTRASAQDQAAKSATIAGVKTIAMSTRPIAIEAARQAEPGLAFEELPGPTDDEAATLVLGRVYVRAEDDSVVVVTRSATGRCFWAQDTQRGTTYAANDCMSPPEFTRSW